MEKQSETNQSEEIRIGRGLSKAQLNLLDTQENSWDIKHKIASEEKKLKNLLKEQKRLQKRLEDAQKEAKLIDKKLENVVNNNLEQRYEEYSFREKLQAIKDEKLKKSQKLQKKLKTTEKSEKKLKNLLEQQKKLHIRLQKAEEKVDKEEIRNKNRRVAFVKQTPGGEEKLKKDRTKKNIAYRKMDDVKRKKLLEDNNLRRKMDPNSKKKNRKYNQTWRAKKKLLEAQKAEQIAKSNETNISQVNKSDESSPSSSKLKRTVNVIVVHSSEVCAESKQADPITSNKTNAESTDISTNAYNPQSDRNYNKQKEVNSNSEQRVECIDNLENVSTPMPSQTKDNSEKANPNIVDNQIHPKLARYYEWKLDHDTNNGEHSLNKSPEDNIIITSNSNSLVTLTTNSETNTSITESRIHKNHTPLQAHLKSQSMVNESCRKIIASKNGNNNDIYHIVKETSLVNLNSEQDNVFKEHLANQKKVSELCLSIISGESTSNLASYWETRTFTPSNNGEEQKSENKKNEVAQHS